MEERSCSRRSADRRGCPDRPGPGGKSGEVPPKRRRPEADRRVTRRLGAALLAAEVERGFSPALPDFRLDRSNALDFGHIAIAK